MALLRAPLFSPPNLLLHPKSLKPHTTNLSSFTSSIPVALNTCSSSSRRRRKSQFSCCTAKNISDGELAIELAIELAKINKHILQRKEAMLKSRELLFGEFCQYLGLRDEKMKNKWRKMDEVERMGCVQKFVSEWNLSFHPLSAKSVKEMVEEHLMEENPSVVSSPSFMFPSLKKLLGFLEDNQNDFAKFHGAGRKDFSVAAP